MTTTLEDVWRAEWGRLLALLVARFRRLDLAEEGLADAFESAAEHWPRDGVPDNPPAWLLTTARRKILDRLRTESVAARKESLLVVDAGLREEGQRTMADPGDEIRDERLRLVLLCAHPSLTREAAAALTLRLVIGLSTQDIGRLFMTSQATMAARLTRARKRLAGATFGVPPPEELAERLPVVADVAYLAFTAGYAPRSGDDVLDVGLAGEAVRLARVLRELLPGRVELDALLALMLIQHSRRDARVRDGRIVLLPDQERTLWRLAEIAEALELLGLWITAPASPYLLQALIAAEHAIALRAEDTDWPRIVERYDELLALADSPVVRLNRAVAVAEAEGPLAGLEALEGVDLPGHRLPAVRAELLARAGRRDEAITAYDAALALCGNTAEATHLRERRDALTASGGDGPA